MNQRNPQCLNIAKRMATIPTREASSPSSLNMREPCNWSKRGGYTRYLVNVRGKTSPYHSKVLKKIMTLPFSYFVEKQESKLFRGFKMSVLSPFSHPSFKYDSNCSPSCKP